ncbi:MAG: twin-arginine translocation signal domain-containing protein [Alphaproteobacteria bacterium]|nr:twin-arginine translocation signal domain-containing protein [Alphaproteobacteria bacterium]NNF24930.1 twin-arginine translocation signal domain-containing protein [Paracoccaceae bacterium]
MTKKTEDRHADKAGRRDFLKMAGVAAPAAVAAASLGGTQAEAASVDPTSDKMQDTEHTRAYLDSARF